MPFDWDDIDVNVDPALVRLADYNSSEYNAGTNPHGMAGGGHITQFPAALDDLVTLANAFPEFADLMSGYADSAAAEAANLSGTSTTSLTIGAGSRSLTTQSGKSFDVGTFVAIINSVSNYMIGQVTAYTGTGLTVNVTHVGGSGTLASWSIYVTGKPGETGATGPTGSTGATGPTGLAAGLAYSFSTNVNATDPTSGKIKFNNATIGSVTEIYISETDNNSNAIAALLATFDDSTSTIKGRLDVVDPAIPTKGGSFSVTGFSDNGSWVTLSVAYISGAAVPDNAATVAVNFSRTGDKGNTGSTGSTGPTGATGRMAGIPMVYDGSSYASGDPGTAKLRRNNATPALVDRLYISETDSDTKGVASWWVSASSGTSTNRGRIDIFHATDPTNFLSYNITGALTDNGGWDTLTVSYRDHGGVLSNTDPLLIHAFASGDKGDTGATGAQGPTGAAGADGVDGAIGPTVTIEFLFDSTVSSSSDPGSGNLRFDSGTYGTVTQLSFDNQDANGSTASAWIDTFDDTTNVSVKGFIFIRQVSNPAVWWAGKVTGSVVDGTGYRKVPVTYVAHNGTFTNAARVSIEYSLAGDKGTDGGGAGDVIGPASAGDGNFVRFDTTTGKLIKDGGAFTAATIPNVAAGTISSTNVQTALNELDTEKAPLASPAFTGTVDVSQAHLFSGVISPTQITADQDNYAPTGFSTCSVVRLTSDAARAITGLAGGSAGRNVLLLNVNASSNITLTHDATSTSANRFYCPNSVNFVLLPNASAWAWYDTTSSRWRIEPAGGNAQGIYAAAQGTLAAGTLYSQLGELDADVTGKSNNGFVTFSGPASSTKTFTLPNANETIACLGQANTWTAAQTFPNSSGVKILDTGSNNTLGIIVGTDFSTNRTLTITPGDADRSITLGGDISTAGALTLSGAYGATFTFSNTTSVTFPTTGTLATLGAAQTFTQPQEFPSIELGHATDTTLTRVSAGVIAVEGVTVATLGAQSFTGAQTFLNSSGIKIKDTDASNTLGIVGGSNLSADRTLTITTGDANRTLSISGDLTIAAAFSTSGANALTLTTTGSTNVTLPTSGTLVASSSLATVATSGSASDLGTGTLPDARLSSAATCFGKQAIPIPATAMTANTTNGPATGTNELSTNKNMLLSLDFDASTSESAQFSMLMPSAWNESTITFQPVWSHAATTTNFGVVWELSAVARSDGEAGDVAFGTGQTSTDTGGTTNTIYIGPESSAITVGQTPSAGDLVMFKIARLPANASDTMAIDARLHGICLYITTDAGHD